MKKLIYLTALLLSFSFVVSSCTKTDDGDDNNVNVGDTEKLLTHFEAITPLATSTIDISYNADLNLDKTIEKAAGVVQSVKKYNFNGSLLTDCKWYSDEAMTNQIGSNIYTINTSGEMTSMVEYDGADTVNYTISWGSGKISEYVAVNNSAPFNDHKNVFEWIGDNISKETTYMRDSTGAFVSTGYMVYTYDDKVNPFNIKYVPEFDASFLSKNNITKIDIYGALGTLQGLSQFTYTYDADDMPTEGTFDYGYITGQNKYTYSDLAKE